MRLTSKVSCAVGIAAAIALTVSAADARSRYVTPDRYNGGYAYSGDLAPSGGRDFVYGADRAPYGRDIDNPRDFQLQGTH